MRLETFFEKFELFADAPNAVGKIRELVLQLAVSGRLFTHLQNANDTWRKAPLGEVARLRRGYDLPTQSRQTGDTPIYAANGTVGTHSEAAVKGPGVVTGRSGSIGKVHYVPVDFWPLNTALYVEDFFGNDPRFVCLLLRSLHLEQFSTCTAVPTLNRNVVHKEMVSVPPLAEQKRIVAKVDDLTALCDRLEAQQQERDTRHAVLARASLARFAEAPTPANLDFLFHKSYPIPPADLRKTILTLAVQGKLVPQDPDDEPAEALLRRIDSEREQLVKAKKIRRHDMLGTIPEDDIPFPIPESWQWRHLADLCFVITDGAHHTPQYLEEGVPFLSVKDVSSGTIDFSSTRYISEVAHSELCKRCRPEFGDILLTKVGTTGIAVAIDDKREFSIFVSLALLKFSQSNLDRQYLMHLINSPFVRQQSADNTQGIGNKNLVLRLINQFTVPIPPLAEQRRIVARVDQLMALVDQLETQLIASRATAAKLMQAVVSELVWNNDRGQHEHVSKRAVIQETKVIAA